MKRRDILAGLVYGSVAAIGAGYVWRDSQFSRREALLSAASAQADRIRDREAPVVLAVSAERKPAAGARVNPIERVQSLQAPAAGGPGTGDEPAILPAGAVESVAGPASVDESHHRLQARVRLFDHDFSDDIYLDEAERPLLESVLLRLERTQSVVGHGNFNVLDFDQLLSYARSYTSVGHFTPAELAFVEKIFFTKASDYGFYGEKVTTELTAPIKSSSVVKIQASGHYLFKGASQAYYDKLRQDIGENIILTSGIRSNVKQLYLFLAKARASQYNLSKASRSLAPPGHSYHGIGDFDVGRVGWGYDNFTDRFASTQEYQRMRDLGYVRIRYTEDNRLGVRFEPWHIKVV